MTEAILLTTWIVTILYFVCKGYNDRKIRENHELWISECQECLYKIECEFRYKCKNTTEKYFERSYNHNSYSRIAAECKREINTLTKEYIDNLNSIFFEKSILFGQKALPPVYLANECKRNIANIAHIYEGLFSLIIR